MKTSTLNRFTVITLFALSAFSFSASAQFNYQHYGEYVYYFTKYIHWPNDSGDLVIATLGKTPAELGISHLSGKEVGNRKIVFKHLNSMEEMTTCDVLYVSQSMDHDLASIAAKAKLKHILVLSETEGGANKGAVINFVHEGDKVRFELNLKTADANGLKISNKLQKLTTRVG